MIKTLLGWLRGRPKDKQEKREIRIVLSGDKILNRFKALMEVAGQDDRCQIVQDALRVYEHIVLEERLGTEFYTRDKETGEFVPHCFFTKYGEEEDVDVSEDDEGDEHEKE